MGRAREPRRLDAPRCLRSRGSARGRGHHDTRDLSVGHVVLYHAEGCHLCERAREVLRASGEEFDEVDITGNPELEAVYREWLPVVEIDGERAFVYFVDQEAFRRKMELSNAGG